MKRILTIAALLFAFTTQVKAAEPNKKFFLEDDGSVTLRVEKIESDLKALESRVAALEGKKLAPAKPAAAEPAKAFKTVRVQTCTNGVCRYEYVQVPADETTAGNPCPMGQCTDCQCAYSTQRTGWYFGKRLGR